MKKSKKENKYIEIELAIFRVHVIVTWESDIEKIVKYGKDRGVNSLTEGWIETVKKTIDKHCNGMTAAYGDDNTDTLVWLKKKPTKASEYGVLYHELYHAVDHISDTHNLGGDIESRAYIYEYLVTECNKVLWK